VSWFIPFVNLLKTKRVFYKDSVRTSQYTLSTSIIKTNLLKFCEVKFAVCSEIHTEHTNSTWSQCRIFNVKTHVK